MRLKAHLDFIKNSRGIKLKKWTILGDYLTNFLCSKLPILIFQIFLIIFFQIEQSLKRLKEIPMNLNILTTTGVGKVINQLKSDENFGRTAQKLVEKWKELAKVESLRKQEQRNSERSASPPESTSTSGSSSEGNSYL